MNFSNLELEAANARLADLRKQAAESRLARAAKLARKR
jgi:hypothetical protein